MKKISALIIAVILTFAFAINVFAAESPSRELPADSRVTYFDDGSYIVEEFRLQPQIGISAAAERTTTQGTKSIHYHNGDDEMEWEYQLIGHFSFTPGVSAVCTSATRNIFIHSNKWSFSNENTYAEGNVAHGKGAFKKKVLLITVKTVDIDVSITCDTNGNLSS